jgi:hypothetical protein
MSDPLESRWVPSASVVSPTSIVGYTVSLPTQLATNAQAQSQLAAFAQTFEQDVQQILLAPQSNGAINPAANRDAFNAAVIQAIDNLNASLIQDLGTTSSTPTSSPTTTITTTPTGPSSFIPSTSQSQVATALVGKTPTSLENQILATPTTVLAGNGTQGSSTTAGSAPTPIPLTVSTTITPTKGSSTPAVGQSLPATSSLGGPSSDSTSTVAAAPAVRAAFGSFLQEYFKAVESDLLANPGQPQANRAAFDAKVSQALQTLNSQIAASLGASAGSNSAARISQALTGWNANSLQSRLLAQPTPVTTQASQVRAFTLGSSQAVAEVLATIMAELAGR